MEPAYRQESIFDISVNSFDDIDKVINSSEAVQKRVRRIHCFRLVKEANNFLEISNLFSKAYQNSIGFPSLCEDVVTGMDRYHAIIKHCITIGNSHLEPLLTALQSHKDASNDSLLQPKNAVVFKTKTADFAFLIHKEFEKIYEDFNSLGYILWKKGKQLDDQIKEQDPLTLKCAIADFWKARDTLCLSEFYLKAIKDSSKCLSNNVVSNPLFIGMKLKTNKPKHIFKIRKVDLTEQLEEVDGLLNESYFEWLALTKAYLAMIASMKAADLELEGHRIQKASSYDLTGERTFQNIS